MTSGPEPAPTPSRGEHPAASDASHPIRRRACDERGDYAIFIAVVATALLLFGGIAYDGPRLNAARSDALHAANEAARVAAATVASGGTLDQARTAAEERMGRSRLIYGQEVHVAFVDCVGSRVQVTVITRYIFRSVLGIGGLIEPIEAVGAAEARLVGPGGSPTQLHYLGECPLT